MCRGLRQARSRLKERPCAPSPGLSQWAPWPMEELQPPRPALRALRVASVVSPAAMLLASGQWLLAAVVLLVHDVRMLMLLY